MYIAASKISVLNLLVGNNAEHRWEDTLSNWQKRQSLLNDICVYSDSKTFISMLHSLNINSVIK
jgi:hypothetical protein